MDSETRARVAGVEAIMNRFNFLFGLVLGEKLLKHTDNLSRSLQAPSLTASEGQELMQQTCQTLQKIRSPEAFHLFWERLEEVRKELGVDEATLGRKRRVPSHLEVGSSKGFTTDSPKDFYKQQYYECLDIITSTIKDRFDQPGYQTLQQLENLFIKAVKGEDYSAELRFTLESYKEDVEESNLKTQLETLPTLFSSNSCNLTVTSIKRHMVSMSKAMWIAYSEICTILRLIMLIPATNAVSERSASALRRLTSNSSLKTRGAAAPRTRITWRLC